MGKPEVHDIDGVALKFYPLGTEDQDLVYGMSSKETRGDSMDKLIKLSLKDEKDITIEELKKMKLGTKNKITEVILNVNGMGEDLAKAKKEFTTKSRKFSK